MGAHTRTHSRGGASAEPLWPLPFFRCVSGLVWCGFFLSHVLFLGGVLAACLPAATNTASAQRSTLAARKIVRALYFSFTSPVVGVVARERAIFSCLLRPFPGRRPVSTTAARGAQQLQTVRPHLVRAGDLTSPLPKIRIACSASTTTKELPGGSGASGGNIQRVRVESRITVCLRVLQARTIEFLGFLARHFTSG